MKKYYLIACFVLLLFQSKAQNWEAILPQHVYNYSVNADINAFYNTKLNAVVNIFVDSITTSNANFTLYALNTVFDREIPIQNNYQIIHKSQFLQKEMWVRGDTVYFKNPNSYMLPLHVTLGQSWLFDSLQNITASVSDIQGATTFGQLDSIKIMVLSTNDTIILSKNFGIIRFPFAYGSSYYYRLVGINDLHLGTTVPVFEDIFDFEVGDKFEYETSEALIPQFQIYTVSKYEIMSKTSLINVFTYNLYGYEKQNVYDNFSGFVHITYDTLQSTITYNINPYISDINHYNYQPYHFISYDNNPTPLIARTQINDTLFIGYPTIFRNATTYSSNCDTSFVLPYPLPDTLCDAFQMDYFFEHGENFIAAKNLGYVNLVRGDIYSNYQRYLVAFQKNGINYGTFTPDSLLIAGIETTINNQFYQLFPNPSKNEVSLSFEIEDDYQIEIHNFLGERIAFIQTETTDKQIISIHDYPIGMYYVTVVNSKGKRNVQKLIKE